MRLIAIILVLFTHSAFAAQDNCLEAPYLAAETDDQRLLAGIMAGLRPELARFPSLQSALDQVRPRLCLADTIDGAVGFFEPLDPRIVLRRAISDGLKTAILVHELRHVEQFTRGYCPSNDVSMKENARAVFAMEADASAIALLVTWSMKTSGRPDPWTALSHWPSQTDIASHFEQQMTAGATVPQAVASTFGHWYASQERLQTYYIASCTDFLDRQDETKLLPHDDRLPDDFLDRLCLLPESTPYPCRETPSGPVSRQTD